MILDKFNILLSLSTIILAVNNVDIEELNDPLIKKEYSLFLSILKVLVLSIL